MILTLKKVRHRIYYYWKLYKKYKIQKRKYINHTVRFYNFWEVNDIQDYWFYKFVVNNNLNTRKRSINFISNYGDKNLIWFIRQGCKIFFTGENLNIETAAYPLYLKNKDHYGDKVDLALGFNNTAIMGTNYMRFPIWILYFVPPESTLESLKKLIAKFNSIETRKNKNRLRFAALISKHDRNGMRKEILMAMNTIDNVCCAGKFMNNSNELKDDYNDDKLSFMKNFKFNICPENSNGKGYVTEKLFQSIMSGCIPVYWGSNNLPESNIINPEAVLFYDSNNKEGFIKRVRELMENEKAYEEFLNIPPFNDNAAEFIWMYLVNFRTRLENVIDKK